MAVAVQQSGAVVALQHPRVVVAAAVQQPQVDAVAALVRPGLWQQQPGAVVQHSRVVVAAAVQQPLVGVVAALVQPALWQQQQQPLASKRILNGRWPFSPNDTLPMRLQQEYFSRHRGN